MAPMTNPDRLTGLDASFLAFEEGGAHMHVGSVAIFDGPSPPYEEFVAQLERRLHLVPRYRQKLAWPPLVQSRPVWVDDPHFNAGYHVRHTALPEPAGEPELRRLAGRVFAQRLDRSKPLWEIWLVDRVGEDRFALISKTHHCLVDGISGVDITTVLFDLEPEPPLIAPPEPWVRRPEPSSATLLADAMTERAGAPLDLARAAAGAVARPRRALGALGSALGGMGAIARAGIAGAPSLAAQPADRPAPALRLGGRRPGHVQGDQERARRHGQRRRPDRRHRRAAGRTTRRTATRARTPSSRRWCPCPCAPRPSAARSATR